MSAIRRRIMSLKKNGEPQKTYLTNEYVSNWRVYLKSGVWVMAQYTGSYACYVKVEEGKTYYKDEDDTYSYGYVASEEMSKDKQVTPIDFPYTTTEHGKIYYLGRTSEQRVMKIYTY